MTNLKQAAVIPAKGIGDALMMMIASHQLKTCGYQVTTFHRSLKQLESWFPGHLFQDTLHPGQFATELLSFDLIIAENDNSTTIRKLIAFAKERHIKLSIYYPTFLASKHSRLSEADQVFDATLPMAGNIARATRRLLQAELPNSSADSSSTPSNDNGICIPPDLIHRFYQKRVVIHPVSSSKEKNWSRAKFLKLAHLLRKKDFEPIFVMDAKEKEHWNLNDNIEFEVAEFKTLDHLARFVYESGFMIGNDSLIGHLASNLAIPPLIIADNPQRMLLWQPGWRQGKVVTPSRFVPNFKFLRLRENQWQHFITVGCVLKNFEELIRRF